MPSLKRPIVGVPCDVKMLGPHPFHAVGQKYLTALDGGSGVLPLPLPVPPVGLDLDEIFALCDGIFLTGSWSNVEPHHYGGPAPRPDTMLDPQRDELALPLIRAAVARGVPLFCVCRGFQELNVVYGGTLHQHLHEADPVEGYDVRRDHRENKDDPVEVQYGTAHAVHLTPDGALAALLGTSEIRVNSLHGQGIDRPGDGLVVEGVADDGTVEAVRVAEARAFALGVQWHPEWKYAENSVSLALFGAFGDAVRAHAEARAKTASGASGQTTMVAHGLCEGPATR